MQHLPALKVATTYHERIWGGQRLRPAQPPIGEAWIIYAENPIVGGPFAGQSLAAVAAANGEALLGRQVVAHTGQRFPLLIKLLDTADWLSLQVHPNDEQAAALEGPGQFGKTEAWHILEAAPGAQIICGVQPGTTRESFAAAVRQGKVAELAQYLPIAPGDTLFIDAGTIHALGPDILLYEVQQTSDITYRVYDWGRPMAAGRKLHLEQTIVVANLEHACVVAPLAASAGTSPQTLTTCPYFTLQSLATSQALSTNGESFHALTVVAGNAELSGPGWHHQLQRFDSLIVPASTGTYQVHLAAGSRLLLASAE